mgnify:CR=1 FL=1
MKVFTLKEIPDIISPNGGIIKGFKAFQIVELNDADAEYLIKAGLVIKLAKQD